MRFTNDEVACSLDFVLAAILSVVTAAEQARRDRMEQIRNLGRPRV
jgi:hypothetical protein